MMRKIIWALAACTLIHLSGAWAQQPQPVKLQPPKLTAEPIEPLNRIAAIVNDEIIAESELDTAIIQLKQQITASNIAMPSETQLRHDALEQLIIFKLQMQMAQRNEIKVSPEEIDKTIDQIASSHKMTTDQLRSQLSAQNISYADFRNKISQQLMINKLQQQMVAGQIKVSDEDIQAFKHSSQGGQDYRLIDFFLPLSEHPSAAELNSALATARDIQKQVNSGVDIDKISPHYQDLGWRNEGDLPELFLQVLKKLPPNQASAPLRAPNGYHVLRIMEIRNAADNLTDDEIRNIVLRQKYEAAVKAAVDKARKEAYVQIIPQ